MKLYVMAPVINFPLINYSDIVLPSVIDLIHRNFLQFCFEIDMSQGRVLTDVSEATSSSEQALRLMARPPLVPLKVPEGGLLSIHFPLVDHTRNYRTNVICLVPNP